MGRATGTGPDVLLIAGLGDPAEAWHLQLQRARGPLRGTAFDNRGAGRRFPPSRSRWPPWPMTPPRCYGRWRSPRPCGRFLGRERYRAGTRAPAPRLAGRLVLSAPGPARTRSCAPLRASGAGCRNLRPASGPSSKRSTCGSTPPAHADGTVDKLIEEVLAFPHKPSTEAIQRSLDAFLDHDTAGRLAGIAAPTLVLAGGLDMITPPRHGQAVAGGIPGARFRRCPRRPTSSSRRPRPVQRPGQRLLAGGGSVRLTRPRPALVRPDT